MAALLQRSLQFTLMRVQSSICTIVFLMRGLGSAIAALNCNVKLGCGRDAGRRLPRQHPADTAVLDGSNAITKRDCSVQGIVRLAVSGSRLELVDLRTWA